MTENYDNTSTQPICQARTVPLVLALTAHGSPAERDGLLVALARGCSQRGGRVLVLERGAPRLADGGLTGVTSAVLESDAPAEILARLEEVAGTPPRYDLVLLDVRGQTEADLLFASLAQRIVVVAEPGHANLQEMRAQMTRLVAGPRQRHFSLAVAGGASEARSLYRQLLEDAPELSRIDCDLVEIPVGLDVDTPAPEMVDDLLRLFWDGGFPQHPTGRLQLFWRSVLFCSDCSLRLCREILAAGRALEACPIHRY